MPCDSIIAASPEKVERVTKKLEKNLDEGTVKVKVGPTGAVAFTGWKPEDREGFADVCMFRRLQSANSASLRRALARAEALAGRTADPRAVASGIHSHDDGETWHPGH